MRPTQQLAPLSADLRNERASDDALQPPSEQQPVSHGHIRRFRVTEYLFEPRATLDANLGNFRHGRRHAQRADGRLGAVQPLDDVLNHRNNGLAGKDANASLTGTRRRFRQVKFQPVQELTAQTVPLGLLEQAVDDAALGFADLVPLKNVRRRREHSARLCHCGGRRDHGRRSRHRRGFATNDIDDPLPQVIGQPRRLPDAGGASGTDSEVFDHVRRILQKNVFIRRKGAQLSLGQALEPRGRVLDRLRQVLETQRTAHDNAPSATLNSGVSRNRHGLPVLEYHVSGGILARNDHPIAPGTLERVLDLELAHAHRHDHRRHYRT